MEEVKIPKAREIEKNQILNKIKQLTTPLGIYQFGILDEPDPSYGYALDDQARALIVAHSLQEKKLEKIYLEYIKRSIRPDGLLYQFFDKDGKFIDNSTKELTETSQDAFGETLWAILITKSFRQKSIRKILENLIEYSIKWDKLFPVAYTLIGLSSLKKKLSAEEVLLKHLINMFERNSSQDWQWFQDGLNYGNAIIPWSLWEVAISRKNQKALEIAQRSTDFLYETCQYENKPAPIGTNGWYKKGGAKALYVQQPICASYMICCLQKAYEATKNAKYKEWAKKWWGWFWGENIKNVSLIDNEFACYDGIFQTGINPNHGAESSICFIMAWIAANKLNI